MFIGREKELTDLNTAYNSGKFQMVVLYGRRRIGKTYLIREFIKDKPAIFFTAQEANDKLNLELFSEKIFAFFGMKSGDVFFKTWNAALEFIADKAKSEQFILAIDELPYACSANKSLRSILQNVIDLQMLESKLFLILCGSQVSFMEKDILGYRSPLYGRRTMQIHLMPFDYYDSAKMLEGFSNEDKIRIYSCIGGTPHYLAQVENGLTFEANIKRLYFSSTAYLYSEPMMLLQQELREPATYNSIISAIAGGATRFNDIVMRVGEEKTKVTKYIATLTGLKLIERIYPIGENPEKSRKGIYQISDNCYRFWYRFVFGNQGEIDVGLGDYIADSKVFGEALPTFIGKPAFEQICMQYLMRENLKMRLPFIATSFGKWWGNDSKRHAETDLDVVAANPNEEKVIIGECKWKNEPANERDITEWMEKTNLLAEYKDRYYVYFSKSGYSATAAQLTDKNEHLKLLTINDLFEL